MKRRDMRTERGFTLIELMISVAIVGVLSAAAIPQFQDYAIRSRWSDSLQSAAPLQTAIAECTEFNAGAIASTCDSVALLAGSGFLAAGYTPAATQFEAAAPTVTTGTGAIVLTGTAQAGNCTVTLTPTAGSQAVTWSYSNSGVRCNRARTGIGT